MPAPEPEVSGPVTITALPQVVNLNLYQGDDFFLDITVTDSQGQPVDLSGSTSTAQIRKSAADATIMASFTVTPEGNVLHLHLVGADAAVLTSGVWDAQIDTGAVTTLVAGTVSITNEVTRP